MSIPGLAPRVSSAPVRTAQVAPTILDALKLDAFLYPTWSNPPRLIGDLNSPHGDNSQFFSPTTGFPAIQVPMGYTRGAQLPAGMTIYGRPWDEASLFNWAQPAQRCMSPAARPALHRPR